VSEDRVAATYGTSKAALSRTSRPRTINWLGVRIMHARLTAANGQPAFALSVDRRIPARKKDPLTSVQPKTALGSTRSGSV